jgi:hypothetical protein
MMGGAQKMAANIPDFLAPDPEVRGDPPPPHGPLSIPGTMNEITIRLHAYILAFLKN